MCQPRGFFQGREVNAVQGTLRVLKLWASKVLHGALCERQPDQALGLSPVCLSGSISHPALGLPGFATPTGSFAFWLLARPIHWRVCGWPARGERGIYTPGSLHKLAVLGDGQPLLFYQRPSPGSGWLLSPLFPSDLEVVTAPQLLLAPGHHASHWGSLTLSFPSGSNGKESVCNAGDPGSIPGSGRSLEKGVATHSSILAWRIPWTEETGRL